MENYSENFIFFKNKKFSFKKISKRITFSNNNGIIFVRILEGEKKKKRKKIIIFLKKKTTTPAQKTQNVITVKNIEKKNYIKYFNINQFFHFYFKKKRERERVRGIKE